MEENLKKKLIESEVRYRRLFETAKDGILILDSVTAQITDVNPFLVELLGYSKEEFLNKKLWEVGAFKNMKESKEAFKILQEDGYVRYENLPLETKDGKSIEVEFVSNSYIAGDILVIQCNIRDITERKKLELMRETERLLLEEKLKVESFADATHELRTPLAIIKGNVDLALLNVDKGKKSPKSAFEAINSEVVHLSNILSDLTLITSDGSGLKNKVIYEKISLLSFVDKIIERSKTLAYKKNISITKKNVTDIDFYGDKVYLDKMLMNLVKNSIMYGNKDGHTVISTRKSKDNIVIDVIDDGIGISDEDLPHVFERFYKADKSHSSDGNSIGLGLAIVKWIAEIHGGSVSVGRTKNKGSVFSVSLPIDSKNRTN